MIGEHNATAGRAWGIVIAIRIAAALVGLLGLTWGLFRVLF